MKDKIALLEAFAPFAARIYDFEMDPATPSLPETEYKKLIDDVGRQLGLFNPQDVRYEVTKFRDRVLEIMINQAKQESSKRKKQDLKPTPFNFRDFVYQSEDEELEALEKGGELFYYLARLEKIQGIYSEQVKLEGYYKQRFEEVSTHAKVKIAKKVPTEVSSFNYAFQLQRITLPTLTTVLWGNLKDRYIPSDNFGEFVNLFTGEAPRENIVRIPWQKSYNQKHTNKKSLFYLFTKLQEKGYIEQIGHDLLKERLLLLFCNKDKTTFANTIHSNYNDFKKSPGSHKEIDVMLAQIP